MSRLSVIIPTHNRGATLARVLEGYRQQTAPADEILVVDDGSSDATAEIVARAAAGQPQIRYFRQEGRGRAGDLQ